ncbi:MAG: hypothetical protein HY077_00165 [Elusimicrobia bacterium]|nr:hypothetical protein [Elusimicrobiota bacterium]
MRRDDARALPALAFCLAALLVGLERVPALTMDEAWIGSFAGQLRAHGAYTLHQMNRYTGPLYAWCAAASFGAFGVSVASLRLTGALCNAAALIGLWAHLRRRVSPEAGSAWAWLAAGSAYMLMKSRLAWEVYALEPVLLAGVLAVLARPQRRGSTAMLSALCWLGALNHFIFLCVPASLALMFGARAAWRGETAARPALRASAAALAAGLALALLKYPIADAQWSAHRFWLAGLLVAGPAAAAAAIARLPAAAWERTLAAAALPRVRRAAQLLLGASLLAFAVWHLAPLVEILAGPVVFMRVFSLTPPLIPSLLLLLWALFLCGVLAWQSVRAWHDERLAAHERTLLLWPAALAAVFIAFRHTSSLRYYCLPVWAAMAGLAAALPRLAGADKKAVRLCAAAAALGTQFVLWREIAAPADRRPLEFTVGWRRESSWDFARKDALFSAYDASHACVPPRDEPEMIAGPMFFHQWSRAVPCDQNLAFEVRRLPEARTPPFFHWSAVPRVW